MDKAKALDIFGRIEGRHIAGWRITSFLDNGKSAAVYRGENQEGLAAIKIFDDDLINRFGGEALLARTEREKLVIGHDHPSLVKMLDAGVDSETGLHYLAMEFLSGKSMAECLDEIPDVAIPPIIRQLASAAKFLEDRGLAHRDIKPANILVSPDLARVTLLDLGVLKPIGENGLTDNGGPTLFVGTNQYASPEFALRHEIDSTEGWRALTFYQLGAVLHDLITKSPIFSEHLGVPARLAHAVQTEVLEIRSATAAPWLVTLAQNCLVKSPDVRLRLVSWDCFIAPVAKRDMGLELQERIRQRVSAATTIDEERRRYEHQNDTAPEVLQRGLHGLIHRVLRNVGRGDPMLGRRIVYDVAECDCIRCDIEPSARLSLPDGLTICVRFSLLDPTSKVVRTEGASRTDCRNTDWTPDTWDLVYEGMFDEGGVEEAIVTFVLSSVDRAQAASLANGE